MKRFKPTLSHLSRRTFLQATAAFGGASALGLRGAYSQEPEKPAEIIVRAWGGSWVD
ncbi:MAG: twin-arginine translocation signal domain-containing protein, partial [Mesorhizobium sp.]